MELYTSRYHYPGLKDGARPTDLAPVPISRGTPRWELPYQLAPTIWYLAPSREAFGIKDPEAFREAYVGQLEDHGVDRIGERLKKMAKALESRGLILLCWEDLRKDWCHRRVFAEWWEAKTGTPVPEFSLEQHASIASGEEG